MNAKITNMKLTLPDTTYIVLWANDQHSRRIVLRSDCLDALKETDEGVWILMSNGKEFHVPHTIEEVMKMLGVTETRNGKEVR